MPCPYGRKANARASWGAASSAPTYFVCGSDLERVVARGLAVGVGAARLFSESLAGRLEAEGGCELRVPVLDGSEVKRFLIFVMAGIFVVLLVPFVLHGQNMSAIGGSWSGIIVSSACDADEAFNESPECLKAVPGASLALYDDTNRVMYGLEPQILVHAELGDTVTVAGTLEGDTIRVARVDAMEIGLGVGQKAPDFSLRDQFGRVQTLESLRGANGTVLLFFRSADW